MPRSGSFLSVRPATEFRAALVARISSSSFSCRAAVSRFCVLNEEDHQKRDDRRLRIDHKLPFSFQVTASELFTRIWVYF
jgi:hypothetical protein